MNDLNDSFWGDFVYFKSRDDLMNYIYCLEEIGHGSQGVCYYNKKNKKVYKIFNQFLESFIISFNVNYDEKEVLKFKDVVNDTFVFADEVIYVADEVVGYICDYYNGKSLYEINPLFISLDKFCLDVENVSKDIMDISNLGIMTFDLMYNMLYGKKGIKIIDTVDYYFSSLDRNILLERNNRNFNEEIAYFLIDGFFDNFISSDYLLSEMYCNLDFDVNKFISLFRAKLSEYLGFEVKKLFDAKSVINVDTNKFKKYLRKI